MAEHALDQDYEDEAPEEDIDDTEGAEESEDDGGEGEEQAAAPQKQAPLKPEEYRQRIDNLTQGLRSKERSERELREKMARMEGAFQQWTQNFTNQNGRQPQQEDDPRPDPDQDPVAWIQWRDRQDRREAQVRQESEARQRQEEQRYQQAQQQWNGFVNTVVDYEQDFRSRQPDYNDAIDHYVDNRKAQMLMAGANEDQAMNEIKREFAQMSDMAMRSGRNPAEVAYSIAQRAGYRPGQGGGRTKLDNVRAGQNAGRNINGGGRSVRSPQLADIADLKGAAFDQAIAKFRADNGLS